MSCRIRKGDVVATLPGRIPEPYLAALGTLKNGIALHQALGVDIPEADYGRLGTVTGAVDYLAGRLAI